jgi:hypothetical protein
MRRRTKKTQHKRPRSRQKMTKKKSLKNKVNGRPRNSLKKRELRRGKDKSLLLQVKLRRMMLRREKRIRKNSPA